MEQFATTMRIISTTIKDIDTNTLHDIENILVFGTIGRHFIFTVVAVQVEDINLVEGVH